MEEGVIRSLRHAGRVLYEAGLPQSRSSRARIHTVRLVARGRVRLDIAGQGESRPNTLIHLNLKDIDAVSAANGGEHGQPQHVFRKGRASPGGFLSNRRPVRRPDVARLPRVTFREAGPRADRTDGRGETAPRDLEGAVQTPARVKVTCVTPLGEEMAST